MVHVVIINLLNLPFRIWDSLGFQRAGLIPRAGRLKKADGSGEEWTDAIVFYKSFEKDD
jgi:hypothetical protein